MTRRQMLALYFRGGGADDALAPSARGWRRSAVAFTGRFTLRAGQASASPPPREAGDARRAQGTIIFSGRSAILPTFLGAAPMTRDGK